MMIVYNLIAGVYLNSICQLFATVHAAVQCCAALVVECVMLF